MMNSAISDTFQTPTALIRDNLSFSGTSVKEVQDWISSLSILQLGDSSKLLFNALIEISELKCSETLRFDLIQVLHHSIENVLLSLEKHFSNHALISSDRNEHIIELAMMLRSYFAKIYQDITLRSHDQLQHQKFSLFAFSQKKNLQTARSLATFYSLRQFAGLLYQQQMLYSSALPGQWQAAHRLYNLALEHDYYNTSLSQIKESAHGLQNIAQAYAQLILLDIFNTHQIRPSEINALYECTFDWARLIQLSTRENNTSKYLVDTRTDERPVFNKKQSDDFQANLFISTQSLLEHINNTLGKNPEYLSKNEKLFLSPALKHHVQTILDNDHIERQHERYEYSAQLQLCFSLMTAHFYMSKAKNFYETLEISTRFDRLNESRMLAGWTDASTSGTAHTKLLDREAKQIYQADVIDISANGYRIKWTGETPKNLRTGEFILVQENNQGKWRSAVIRWIKQAADKSLELGIEILAQEIYPCAVHIKPERHLDNYHPALILQNEQDGLVKTSLVLPGSQMFKDQQTIYLRLGKEEIKIYLLKTLAITQSFVQFEFELLNDQQQSIVDQFIHQKADELKDHDLWEALK